jgi:hypothetical protein
LLDHNAVIFLQGSKHLARGPALMYGGQGVPNLKQHRSRRRDARLGYLQRVPELHGLRVQFIVVRGKRTA